MALLTQRAAPTAKARLPFVRPQEQAWRSGQPRARVVAVIGAALAGGAAIAVAWTWRRRGPQPSRPGDRPLRAVPQAVGETAARARAGYETASAWQQGAFNLSAAAAATIGIGRAVTYGREQRRSLRSMRAPQSYRVHHYVPGIALAFLAGGAGTLIGDEAVRRWLAVPFGIGVALTLDEAALLLERSDLYWKNERLPMIEGTVALAAAGALAGLFLRSHGNQADAGRRAPGPLATGAERLAEGSTKEELLRRARELDIRGRSRMTKLELARAISRQRR